MILTWEEEKAFIHHNEAMQQRRGVRLQVAKRKMRHGKRMVIGHFHKH